MQNASPMGRPASMTHLQLSGASYCSSHFTEECFTHGKASKHDTSTTVRSIILFVTLYRKLGEWISWIVSFVDWEDVLEHIYFSLHSLFQSIDCNRLSAHGFTIFLDGYIFFFLPLNFLISSILQKKCYSLFLFICHRLVFASIVKP
jgi:hypothetical protein